MEGNILRKRKSHTKLIVALLICVYLFATAWIGYLTVGYTRTNGLSISSLRYTDYIHIISKMFSFKYAGASWSAFVSGFKEYFVSTLYFQVVAMLCIIYFSLPRWRNPWKNVEYGSERWGTEEQKKGFADPSGVPVADNFFLPVSTKPYKRVPQTPPPNHHIAVSGNSGAGKTFQFIAPQVICCLQNGDNICLTDPKGETARNSIKLAEMLGYDVKVLNFYDVTASNSYNPFRYIRSETDIVKLANIFILSSQSKGEKKDFWTNSAQLILMAIMTYLYDTENERRNFGRVVELISSITYENGFISQSCEYARCMQSYELRILAETGNPNVAVLNWRQIQGIVEQTLSGQISTLITRLALWTTLSVKSMTTEDEMNFDDFCVEGKKKIIYIITPPSDSTYDCVISMFYTQLYDYLQFKTTDLTLNGRLPTTLHCIMDEFPNCAEIPEFSKTIQVVRGYNIMIAIVMQNLTQLKERYKDTWQSVLDGCATLVYMGGGEDETLKFVVNKLGDTTIEVETKSYNRYQSGGSDNINKKERKLLTANELERYCIKNKACIVFCNGLKFAVKKFNTQALPLFKHYGADARFKGAVNNTDIATWLKSKRESASESDTESKEQNEEVIMQSEGRQAFESINSETANEGASGELALDEAIAVFNEESDEDKQTICDDLSEVCNLIDNNTAWTTQAQHESEDAKDEETISADIEDFFLSAEEEDEIDMF